MEWLLEKMLKKAMEESNDYSPMEQVKQTLDYHQEILNHQQKAIVYILLGITFLSLAFVIYVISNEIRFYKFKRKIGRTIRIVDKKSPIK